MTSDMAASNIVSKVEKVLHLLEIIERGIRTDASPLKSSLKGERFVTRLREVASLVERKCNSVAIKEDNTEQSKGFFEAPLLESVDLVSNDSATDRDSDECSEESVELDGPLHPPRRRTPTRSTTSATSQQHPSLSSQSQPNVVQSPLLPDISMRFKKRSFVLDEHARRHSREAKELARLLEKQQSFSCGVGYTGNEKEKEFSDGIKRDIRDHLPHLKNHKVLFYYMALATRERLECDHCRKCKNKIDLL